MHGRESGRTDSTLAHVDGQQPECTTPTGIKTPGDCEKIVFSKTGGLSSTNDPPEPAIVIKSVIQTAGFAGFSNSALVVRRRDGSLGILGAEAQVPGPTTTSNNAPVVLPRSPHPAVGWSFAS